MTLDEIIEMFDAVDCEREITIPFHLHKGIHQANSQLWNTNHRFGANFSEFLRALKEAEPPTYAPKVL
jgi:hypothetical protein